MTIHRTAVPLGVLLALAACKNEKAAEQPSIVRPVLSIVVNPQSSRGTSFVGTVEPRYQTSLGFRVLGRMIARDVNVGDSVSAGARLAAIDPLALELAVRQAQASLASAEAQLVNATATEARQRQLLEQNHASQAQFEVAQKTRETAAAAVVQARANLAKAEQQLGYARLTAEFDGVVTSIQTEVGQVVSPGQVVMIVARPDVREAVVDMPDRLVEGLSEGARFTIALQLDPSIRTSGVLREVAPQSDPITRTRRARIAIDVPPPGFRLGTTVAVTPSEGVTSRIELPASGLLERDGKTMVWVVDPVSSQVLLREVAVATRNSGRVEVAGGLDPGTRVVVAGVNSLVSGQHVKVPEGGRP
ncbi:MAG TPA: efflux RND transporter periplasmic adaptor subunit [Vineibacter sp.]|nr:efflux RND transporter periplasmic adaptor subunit [Vineibacter sp.]